MTVKDGPPHAVVVMTSPERPAEPNSPAMRMLFASVATCGLGEHVKDGNHFLDIRTGI